MIIQNHIKQIYTPIACRSLIVVCTHCFLGLAMLYIYDIYIYIYIYIYGVSILYPSWQNRLAYPSNKPRKLFYILPYGLRIILCVRAHHITEPTWVGLGPIEPRARDQVPRPKELRAPRPRPSSSLGLGPWSRALGSMGPSPTHAGSVI